MKAPVAYPLSLKSSAMVTRGEGTTNPPLSRTPWKSGRVPVMSVVCDGRVRGVWAKQRSKRTPREAKRSIVGVSTFRKP